MIDWRQWFHRFLSDPANTNLKFFSNVKVRKAPNSINGKVEVKFSDRQSANSAWADRANPEQFDLVLLTCGFGEERTYIIDSKSNKQSDFTGFPFWSADAFDDSNFGLMNGVIPRILIAGGGDGALQDYIRITTNRTMAKAPWDILKALNLDSKLLMELRKIEDQAQKQFVLNPNIPNPPIDNHPDHNLNLWIHERYIEIIHNNNIVFVKKADLDRIVRADLPELKLVHWCNHFDHCYPLNRFLVLLINEYIKTYRNMVTLQNQTAIRWIDCDGGNHGAASPSNTSRERRASACHGNDHKVSFVRASGCALNHLDWADKNPIPDETFNVLIIRYGISPPSILIPEPPIPKPPPIRELLPGLAIV